MLAKLGWWCVNWYVTSEEGVEKTNANYGTSLKNPPTFFEPAVYFTLQRHHVKITEFSRGELV